MADFWNEWERFFSELSSFLRYVEVHAEQPNKDFSEYVVHRIEIWIVSVNNLVSHIQENMDGGRDSVAVRFAANMSELIHHLRIIQNKWNDYVDDYDVRSPHSYAVSVEDNGYLTGRPRYNVSKEQLQYLRSMSFSWIQISQILGVSYMTVYRRRIEYGIPQNRGREIGDADLDRIVTEVRHEQRALGQTMIWAHLRSLGFRVTRARIRDAIHRVDPISSTFRWREMTPRRPYSVPSPNSLWHLDGQHKLIRWRMVVHAAIDGYSRCVVFIKCSDNNRASTVLNSFLGAVGQYGLPSRIRVDQGGENTLVAQHMLRHRGVGRRSVLVGSSVHNQRIERLWRDSHRCATAFYYRLFYFLEENDLLDPLDEEHLYALHYVYLTRVNRSLQVFRSSWNDHGLRTEASQSPNQLFTAGVLRLRHSGLVAVDFFDRITQDYGTGEEGLATEDDTTGVTVERISVTPSHDQMMELRENVDPSSTTDDYGISMYSRTVEIVKSWSRSV